MTGINPDAEEMLKYWEHLWAIVYSMTPEMIRNLPPRGREAFAAIERLDREGESED